MAATTNIQFKYLMIPKDEAIAKSLEKTGVIVYSGITRGMYIDGKEFCSGAAFDAFKAVIEERLASLEGGLTYTADRLPVEELIADWNPSTGETTYYIQPDGGDRIEIATKSPDGEIEFTYDGRAFQRDIIDDKGEPSRAYGVRERDKTRLESRQDPENPETTEYYVPGGEGGEDVVVATVSKTDGTQYYNGYSKEYVDLNSNPQTALVPKTPEAVPVYRQQDIDPETGEPTGGEYYTIEETVNPGEEFTVVARRDELTGELSYEPGYSNLQSHDEVDKIRENLEKDFVQVPDKTELPDPFMTVEFAGSFDDGSARYVITPEFGTFADASAVIAGTATEPEKNGIATVGAVQQYIEERFVWSEFDNGNPTE